MPHPDYTIDDMRDERGAEKQRLATYKRQRANVYAVGSATPLDECIERADELDALIAFSESEIVRLGNLICEAYRAQHPSVSA